MNAKLRTRNACMSTAAARNYSSCMMTVRCSALDVLTLYLRWLGQRCGTMANEYLWRLPDEHPVDDDRVLCWSGRDYFIGYYYRDRDGWYDVRSGRSTVKAWQDLPNPPSPVNRPAEGKSE